MPQDTPCQGEVMTSREAGGGAVLLTGREGSSPVPAQACSGLQGPFQERKGQGCESRAQSVPEAVNSLG